ncbi:VanZ family protein [Photobacterium rosenbergii]|uniref:VanZ family protein n=1 Tax=Photobacterium rosenbergii TaxID=294936 RepID=A0ABU3ZPU1_9GAMM|nr:VanZ family protein [Photobacterium rosenbergii]MDV5172121.1 VanZ family protein [Photobacterium rosenbergii]
MKNSRFPAFPLSRFPAFPLSRFPAFPLSRYPLYYSPIHRQNHQNPEPRTQNPEPRTQPMLRKLPLFLYALLILYLSLKPSGPEIVSIPHIDKLQHFMAYTVFAVVAAYAVSTKRAYYKVCIAIVLFSGAIELIQPSFGRECSFFDWLANSLGVSLGMFVTALLYNQQKRLCDFLNLSLD